MPEGPSIVILREQGERFEGQVIRSVSGNSRLDLTRMQDQTALSLRSWGKHFLIVLPDFTMRVHFMLFGSYRIDERKPSPPRMSLGFDNGELNFYACSLRFIEEDIDLVYEWSADVLSDRWDPQAARRKLRARPDRMVCDVLLDQGIFAGVGNIIKNEVLFRIRVHPESRVGALSARKLNDLVREARQYSFDFLAWKKAYVLRKHWLAHTKRTCTRCNLPLEKAYLGQTNRRSFFCTCCQVQYE